MNVNWKYDILFSINITFDAPLQPNDFRVIPSKSCRSLLKKHGLIFRPVENGGIVIAEKRIHSDHTTTPLFPIKSLTVFAFALHLNNSSLFSRLRPYSTDPSAVLPDFYGQRRALFFDNLNIDLEPDVELVDIPQTQMPATNLKAMEIASLGTVSDQDLASLVPNEFSYRRENNVNQITLQGLSPENEEKEKYNLSDKQPHLPLKLATKAYRFEQNGSATTSEIIVADAELLPVSTFGIVHIYKDATIDYSTAIRYDIKFEES